MQRFWIHEWGEIDKITRKREADEIKAFLSKTEDVYRAPYARVPQRVPRSSIIVGSTNRDDFLKDVTGNRRFLVISLNHPIDISRVRKERDRLWAAAVAAYRAGENWHWSRDEINEIDKRASDYMQRDPWENPIERYLETHGNEVTSEQVLDHCLGLELSRRDAPSQRRVADILKGLGWKRRQRKVSGKNVRTWVRPEPQLDPGPTVGLAAKSHSGTAERYTGKGLQELSHWSRPFSTNGPPGIDIEGLPPRPLKFGDILAEPNRRLKYIGPEKGVDLRTRSEVLYFKSPNSSGRVCCRFEDGSITTWLWPKHLAFAEEATRA